MNFLKNPEESKMVCWHGTCANFDVFYPLSHFAVEKLAADSAEFYEDVRQPQKERLEQDFVGKMLEQNTKEAFDNFCKKIPSPKKKRHPDFKIIPVHLKIKNPLCLTRWGFDLEWGLIGLIWSLSYNPNENFWKRKSNATCDFIFKDSQTRPHEEIQKELKLGHLFPVTDNEEKNRYHLTAQRFILFLEKLGYDGIQYDYMKESVDAYREGRIKNFDNRVFVTFRPEQIIRLDKKVETPLTRSSAREKIELNKIYCRYLQTYIPYKTSMQEILHRVECITTFKKDMYLKNVCNHGDFRV